MLQFFIYFWLVVAVGTVLLPLAWGKLRRLATLVLDHNCVKIIPRAAFEDSALSTLSVKHNPFDATDMRDMPGFEAYNARRIARDDKTLDNLGSVGALLGDHFGDEGADRRLYRR